MFNKIYDDIFDEIAKAKRMRMDAVRTYHLPKSCMTGQQSWFRYFFFAEKMEGAVKYLESITAN